MKLSARALTFFVIAIVLAPMSLVFAVSIGSVPIPWEAWPDLLTGNGDPSFQHIVWEIRWPRASSAFVVGGLLALAGVLMQTLLRNPLADPYVLGISGGASVAVLLAILLGITASLLPWVASAGALLSVVLVFAMAYSSREASSTRLLLTGVILAAGWSAMVALLLSIAPDMQLRSMLFWLMGDLSDAQGGWIGAFVLFALLTLSSVFAADFNQLLRGERFSASLGVNTQRVRVVCYFAGSIATGMAVSLAGAVGFVGLLVPHIVRMFIGSDHRIVLPGSVLFGGILVVFADTFARSVIAPIQLPVGAIMALIGVPVFLFLLSRGYRPWP